MITEVVAALIRQGERFLVCRRPEHKARGLLWEFAGGKVEPGETGEEALTRECREELEIEVEVGDLFAQLIHQYPDLTVRLRVYNAVISRGTIRLVEHCGMAWVTAEEALEMDFCPADTEILALLKNR